MKPVSNNDRRPLAPNVQIYRPQLTSVLSIAHRVTGLILSLFAIALFAWLMALAGGPESYARLQEGIHAWYGLCFLLLVTFSFFLHLFNGIRHLVWDTVHGFELRQIYASGWLAVAMSVLSTAVTWVIGSVI